MFIKYSTWFVIIISVILCRSKRLHENSLFLFGKEYEEN